MYGEDRAERTQRLALDLATVLAAAVAAGASVSLLGCVGQLIGYDAESSALIAVAGIRLIATATVVCLLGVNVLAFSAWRLSLRCRSMELERVRWRAADQALRAAEAANRAKTEFLSRISHDIRTPLNAIAGLLEIAGRSAGDSERLRDCLAKIGLASNELLGLVNNVLDMTKIESGKTSLAKHPFRLRALIDELVVLAESQCTRKGQALHVDAPVEEGLLLLGDGGRLRRVVLNLLSNAVKYTPEGGNVRLEVRTESAKADRDAEGVRSDAAFDRGATAGVGGRFEARRVVIEVADDGIGMSEEFKERLFEPFSMEGRSGAQGTGLGLAIVKSFVEAMGGAIAVDTKEGVGTTFAVEVVLSVAPAVSAGGSSAAVPPPSASAVSSAARPPASAPADPLADLGIVRVLLAEDNELNAQIECELLKAAGLAVDRAENGAEALRLFERSELGFYDAILMDVRMPVMDGHEAARRIRALSRKDAHDIPILAMSANAFAEDVRASRESGMDDHLTKPIDVKLVVGTVARRVRNRRG